MQIADGHIYNENGFLIFNINLSYVNSICLVKSLRSFLNPERIIMLISVGKLRGEKSVGVKLSSGKAIRMTNVIHGYSFVFNFVKLSLIMRCAIFAEDSDGFTSKFVSNAINIGFIAIKTVQVANFRWLADACLQLISISNAITKNSRWKSTDKLQTCTEDIKLLGFFSSRNENKNQSSNGVILFNALHRVEFETFSVIPCKMRMSTQNEKKKQSEIVAKVENSSRN